MKSNPEQTICDEAERLWGDYQKAIKEGRTSRVCRARYIKYVRHVENCPEDFKELKKERQEKLNSSLKTKEQK